MQIINTREHRQRVRDDRLARLPDPPDDWEPEPWDEFDEEFDLVEALVGDVVREVGR